MRLHRFYLENKIIDKNIEITDKDMLHQWRKVFRYNIGDQVIVFDGSGFDYLCIISSINNLNGTLSILEQKEILKPKRSIWLCQSIIKKDNFEVVVQKGTELGVTNFLPIVTERGEKKKINLKRLEKIIKESSEQSGRGDLPILHLTQKIEDLLSSGILPQEKIFLDFDFPPLSQYLNSNTEQKSFAIFVGPEGGWSEKEIEIFKKYNVLGFSIGNQVLRAETASIAVASLFLL